MRLDGVVEVAIIGVPDAKFTEVVRVVIVPRSDGKRLADGQGCQPTPARLAALARRVVRVSAVDR